MPTAAQIQANRSNSGFSTGPTSDLGKAKVSQNALRTGLFSSRNCVAPQDAEAYEALRASLWEHFAPQNPAEELFTAEIVRASWRLQRCAHTEEALLDLTCPREIAANQASVDRARTQASGVLHRAMEQLRKLQTERWTRRETLPKEFDTTNLGLAATKQVLVAVAYNQKLRAADENAKIQQAMSMPEEWLIRDYPSAKQSQSTSDPMPSPAAAPTESSNKSTHSTGFL